MSLPSDWSLRVFVREFPTWPVQASSILELSQVPNCQMAPGFVPCFGSFKMVSGLILFVEKW